MYKIKNNNYVHEVQLLSYAMETSFTTDVTSNAKEPDHYTNKIISQPKKPIFSQYQKFHFS